jgi:nicotinamidase-related amidase
MSKNVLVLIDIQLEYTTPGRPFYLQGIEPSLSVCHQVLQFARSHAWEIIHVQHSNGESAPRFNPTTPYFNFVLGFLPGANERHFVKTDFSCYSNEGFSDNMNALFASEEKWNVYLIGYNSVMCCLSTLEEARRRKHKMFLIEDASFAKRIEAYDEKTMHGIMLDIYRAKGLATIVKSQTLY